MKRLLTNALAFMLSLAIISSLSIAVFATDRDAEDINAPDLNDPERLEEIAETNEKIDNYISQKFASPARSSSSNYLNVPLYQQINSYYCGPASVQMVVKYCTNSLISQSTLASSMGTSSSGGTYVYQVTQELNKRVGGYQYTGTWEYSFSNGLIYSIDKGKPVVCHLMTGSLPNYPTTANSGHYVVATGYYVAFSGSSSTSTCRYNDPHYNSSYYGTYTCSISEMTAAINANAGYYIRST